MEAWLKIFAGVYRRSKDILPENLHDVGFSEQ